MKTAFVCSLLGPALFGSILTLGEVAEAQGQPGTTTPPAAGQHGGYTNTQTGGPKINLPGGTTVQGGTIQSIPPSTSERPNNPSQQPQPPAPGVIIKKTY
jgi:hypothetical protein